MNQNSPPTKAEEPIESLSNSNEDQYAVDHDDIALDVKDDKKESSPSKKYEDKGFNQRAQGFFLSQDTQKTIMQIITTLKNNQTPDAAQQLFMTLSETSQSIESANLTLTKQKSQSVVSEAAEEEEKKEAEKKEEPAVLSIEDQLKMLLTNLQNNKKLKTNGSPSQESESSGINYKSKAHDSVPAFNKQASTTSAPSSLMINSAYALINEVIMHPSIMWNRQFFYSLGAMPESEQDLMNEWFSEMNEKQKIYIYEIERANDQLKATAGKLFADKGFSREQADLFLKKVSFMENRDYFKLKRRQVHGQTVTSSEDSSDPVNDENERVQEQRQHVQAKRKNQPFFDTITSSCRIDRFERRDRRNNDHYEPEYHHEEQEDRGSYKVWNSHHDQQQSHHHPRQYRPNYRSRGRGQNHRGNNRRGSGWVGYQR